MTGRRSAILIAAFVLPALVALVGTGSFETSGSLQAALVVGVVSVSVTAVILALVRREKVPLAAVAILCALVPAAALLVGLWITLASSETAGDWIIDVAGLGLLLAALAFLAALLFPDRRRAVTVLCTLVVATAVPAGVLAPVAETAGGRHRSWVADFPAAGESRPATQEELQYVGFSEAHMVTRVWDASGVDCTALDSVLARHAGARAQLPEQISAPGPACHASTETAWRGTYAAVTGDGCLIVAAWSPTADLFGS